MFPLQSIVFIAVLCAVHAAVTVNIYEDDVESIKSNKLDEVVSCNDGSCYRTCRRLGFDFGVCVGDTCECRKFHKDNELLEQNDIPSLDESFTRSGLGGCNPSACDQLCRRLKFPGGVCVNGRCKCDNFRQEPELLEQNDIPSLDEGFTRSGLDGCNPSACDQLCRRLKFPGGVCVNGRCKCDNFRREPEAMMEREVEEQVQARCTNTGCSILCHLLGFRYGVCVGDTCKCSNVLRTDVLELSLSQGMKEDIVNSVEPNVDTVVTEAVRNCDPLACMMWCQELGFLGGSCILDKCRCNKRGKEEEIVRSLRACNSATCNMMCLRLKYKTVVGADLIHASVFKSS
ncbi:tenascin-like isoform X1 [Maniola hyperantus]|uniref:tenascin-like isoform X1 n=1 Tax=Aphantopus hyperantus TaxID=2795564 RepID=UPI002120F0FF